MQSSRNLVLALTVLLLAPRGVAAQDESESVEVLRLNPPVVVLDGVSRLAVVDFEAVGPFPPSTQAGSQVADLLTNALNDPAREHAGLIEELGGEVQSITETASSIGSAIGGLFGGGDDDRPEVEPVRPHWASTQVFEVVDRTAVRAAMERYAEAGDTALTNEALAGIGSATTADAILTGVITRLDDASDVRTTEDGEACFTRYFRVSATLRVLRVSDGTIIAAPEPVNESVSSKQCGRNARQNLPSQPSLLADVIERLRDDLADAVAPHFSKTDLSLLEIEGPGRESGETGAERAAAGDLYGAYAAYAAVAEEDPFSPEAAYNLGVLNEAVGNFEAAAERYAYADELAPDVSRFASRAERAMVMAGEIGVWEALGLEYAPVSWPTAAAGDLGAGTTVRTVGDRGTRHDVFESPGDDEPAMQVPGGITATVIQEDGDWLQLRLPGDRELWILRENVVL